MSFFNLRACTLQEHPVAHEHAYHQLILATSGTTELRIEHQGQRITRDCGCLIPSTYHHAYQGDGRNRTLVLDIPLASIPLANSGDELERLFSKPRFFTVTPQIHQLSVVMMQQVESTPELQGDISGLILRALYSNLYGSGGRASRKGSWLRHHCRDRLDLARIDTHIDVHLADPIHVDDLASLCALSPGHFHASFRSATGQTPLAYVQKRRLEHARALIQRTDLALGHIAQLVGFADQGSFSRAYRRHFDTPPSLNRQRTGQGGSYS